MTEYNVSLTSEQLKGLLTEDEGLKGVIEATVNQVLGAQMTEYLSGGCVFRSLWTPNPVLSGHPNRG